MGPGTGLRLMTPVLLVLLALMVWCEPWLPESLRGPALLRFVIGVLALYILVLWNQHDRLQSSFTRVLKLFRDFHEGKAAAKTPQAAKLEAMRLLVAAMASPDAKVRDTSHQNLVRLAGEDLGADPAAWQAWLDRQEA